MQGQPFGKNCRKARTPDPDAGLGSIWPVIGGMGIGKGNPGGGIGPPPPCGGHSTTPVGQNGVVNVGNVGNGGGSWGGNSGGKGI